MLAGLERSVLGGVDGEFHECTAGGEFGYCLSGCAANHVSVHDDGHSAEAFESPECESDVEPNFIAPVVGEAENDVVPAANESNDDHNDV